MKKNGSVAIAVMAISVDKTNKTGNRLFRWLRAFVMSDLPAMASLILRGLLHIGCYHQRTNGKSRMLKAINAPNPSTKAHEKPRRNTRVSTTLRETLCVFVDELEAQGAK